MILEFWKTDKVFTFAADYMLGVYAYVYAHIKTKTLAQTLCLMSTDTESMGSSFCRSGRLKLQNKTLAHMVFHLYHPQRCASLHYFIVFKLPLRIKNPFCVSWHLTQHWSKRLHLVVLAWAGLTYKTKTRWFRVCWHQTKHLSEGLRFVVWAGLIYKMKTPLISIVSVDIEQSIWARVFVL